MGWNAGTRDASRKWRQKSLESPEMFLGGATITKDVSLWVGLAVGHEVLLGEGVEGECTG